MTQAFYDQLAPYYHLLYPDWEASVARQGRGLATVLEEVGIARGARILDAACGIGTQMLGLAQLGYSLTASDVSPIALARARAEAEGRGLDVAFAAADLRQLATVFPTPFAAVIACDNAVPHLLSDADILAAFTECHRALEPGGALLISVRDYAAIERRTPDVHSYGHRTEGDCRYSAQQTWRWEGDQYDLSLQLTQQCGDDAPVVRTFHTRYYAVELRTLERLLHEAGFERITRRDEHFFQPLLVALRPPAK
jgi:SAM-dependent methyltransferase